MMKAQYNMDFSKLYVDWLKENIDQFKVSNNTFRLTLPFLDVNNDHVEMYIISNNDDTYTITDDGATIRELSLTGFELFNSSKRKSVLESIINSHGIKTNGNNELFVQCTMKDLPAKKHMLAQCMIKVSDMFYLTKNNVQSLFLEDVQNYFDSLDIRYLPNISITGKSKLTTHFDFAIPKSKNAAERFIKVVNNMDLSAAKNIIFAWNDTRDMREQETTLYTFIHDSEKRISEDAIGALKEYGIKPALWSKRDELIGELIA